MIKGIHHFSMKCGNAEDMRKVKEFYISLLGLRIIREWSDGIMIDTGNGFIEIFTNAEGEHRLGAIRHIAFVKERNDMKNNKFRREPLTDTQLLMTITICIFVLQVTV